MNNDSLHILKALYEEGIVDTYQLHMATKIPPTTIYVTLEREREKGCVERKGLLYRITERGESLLANELGQALLRPSMSFKAVPEKYSGPQASADDVSVIGKIVQ